MSKTANPALRLAQAGIAKVEIVQVRAQLRSM
jgi:hypothetical protein